jgi:hypothetical protein
MQKAPIGERLLITTRRLRIKKLGLIMYYITFNTLDFVLKS